MQEHVNKRGQHEHGYDPPKPTDSTGTNLAPRPKLLLHKFIIVESFRRQAETLGMGLFGPASLLVSAALRTSQGLGRHFSAAIRASFG
jgi:hypothetical protein